MDSQVRSSAGSPISGFILAGGKSSRLGRDKALLPWFGETLLIHAVERLQQVCGSVAVCGNRPDLRGYLPQSVLVLPDAWQDAGPLGGIVSALESSRTDWNFFLAVDLPFVPVALLAQTVASTDHTDASPEILCIMPRIAGREQPLCALYRRALAPGMRSALEQGEYKILSALAHAISKTNCPLSPSRQPIQFIDVDALHPPMDSGDLGPSEWFLNINTAEDWQRARDLASSETKKA